VAVAADFDKGINAYDSGDYKTALAEWTPLAEQGDARAQFRIGDMYSNGEGVPFNHKMAVKWNTLAAEQGYADAQYNLAWMYATGFGVLTNNNRAYMWLNLSAFNGNQGANEYKDNLAKQMNLTEISKAQEMSSRCLESNYTDC
jgi:TPR repeat protein